MVVQPKNAKKITDEDVLNAARAVLTREDVAPVVQASDVADELGVSDKSAREYLNDLADEGRIQKTRKGSSNIYYFEENTDEGVAWLIEEDLAEAFERYKEYNNTDDVAAVREMVRAGLSPYAVDRAETESSTRRKAALAVAGSSLLSTVRRILTEHFEENEGGVEDGDPASVRGEE